MNKIAELIEDIKQGKMVILVDDEDRENEGDLIMAADYITPEYVNFMATSDRGYWDDPKMGWQMSKLFCQ